jgi:hypothetical protein
VEKGWPRKMSEDIYVSAHVDDCLIACKSKDIIVGFKKEILTRCKDIDEGEVTAYLACELIRDCSKYQKSFEGDTLSVSSKPSDCGIVSLALLH